MLYDMNELVDNIEMWGLDRGIIQNGTQLGQLAKMFEEAGEVIDAVSKEDRSELLDAIGDTVVTLIMLAGVSKVDFSECVHNAYNEIKYRKGYLREDGVFVKDVP